MPISRVRSRDGDEHDVHNADAADDERYACDAAEQDLENVRHGPHRVLHDTHGIDVEAVAVAEKVIEELFDGCLGVGHFRALRRGDVKFGNRAAVLGVLPREGGKGNIDSGTRLPP